MKYIIGVTGENGSGKGSFSDSLITQLKSSKVSKIKFSDVLFSTLKNWNIDTTRNNLQNLAIIMDKQYGVGSVTRAAQVAIKKNPAEIIIVDGVRWESDVQMIRSFKNNALVYVTADPKVRYERMRKRGEKVGENILTYKQFLDEEKAGTETQIKKIGKLADFKIENNGTPQALNSQVKLFINKFNLLESTA